MGLAASDLVPEPLPFLFLTHAWKLLSFFKPGQVWSLFAFMVPSPLDFCIRRRHKKPEGCCELTPLGLGPTELLWGQIFSFKESNNS